MMKDDYLHKGLRRRLALELKEKGIQDNEVLKAINRVPRHFFMDSAFLNHAYEDKAFPIGDDQTISQPYTVAFQTQLLELDRGDKILEIGTGSGYQAAVLGELCDKVYSIERQKRLYLRSKRLLGKMKYKVACFYGDGYKGKPDQAPFDKIIITCGAPEIPKTLLGQLKIGGWMIIPVGKGNSQVMKKIVRVSATNFKAQDYGVFSFVPMLQDRVDGGLKL